MDPLSVAASIVGILAAAAQVSANVSTLVEKSRKAPKHIRKVKDEVDTIRSILHQLQALLLGSAKTSRARTSLILVDQVVVTLTACVSTFSELDVIVGTLVLDEKLGLMDRLRWGTKAAAIDESLKDLQIQKSTLTLMLTILTWYVNTLKWNVSQVDYWYSESSYKAEDSVTNLTGLVESMLAGHEKLAKRLSCIEMTMVPTTKTENPTQNNRTDLLAIGTINRNQFGFVFEEELNGSWVYRRAARRIDSASSIVSSAGKTASWSMLTGLSLSNISNLSVLALPIYAEEISNRELYQFGKVDIGNWRQDAAFLPVLGPERNGKGFKGLTVFASTKPPKNSVETANSSDTELNPIFGVPLLSGMKVASVTTGLVEENGEMFISGHIPTVVARCCAYIKEEGKSYSIILSLDELLTLYSLRPEDEGNFLQTGLSDPDPRAGDNFQQ
jgi:Fungal N-terminal domain of STAND proteins